MNLVHLIHFSLLTVTTGAFCPFLGSSPEPPAEETPEPDAAASGTCPLQKSGSGTLSVEEGADQPDPPKTADNELSAEQMAEEEEADES